MPDVEKLNAEARDTRLSIQSRYPEEFQHCYGCGQLNAAGLKLESYWEGEEAVCHFRPRPEHHAMPGIVYGGLIASLIDCHSIGTGAAAIARHEGLSPTDDEIPRCVTGSLHVEYRGPTPEGVELVLRAWAEEVKSSKAIVNCTLEAEGKITAEGRVVAVRLKA